jgi:hypothetical protein
MKLGIIISTNDAETVWNAFRYANYGLNQNLTGKIIILIEQGDKIQKDTARDYFMSAQESKDYGLIDEVILPEAKKK